MRQTQKVTLYNAVTPKAITSSTDATPIVMTVTAHGFVTGDRVLIIGHATNIAANGIYKVTVLSSSTFSLQDEFTGANIAGSGAGAGTNTGICLKAPPILLVTDFRDIEIQSGTSGTATTTLKFAGSQGIPDSASTYNPGNPRKDLPNFAATVSPSNPYTFLQGINLDTGSAINGATGIVVAGTDVNVQHEVNVNAQKWFTAFPVSWTQGAITMVAFVTTNI